MPIGLVAGDPPGVLVSDLTRDVETAHLAFAGTGTRIRRWGPEVSG
jgi:hypothetical protein